MRESVDSMEFLDSEKRERKELVEMNVEFDSELGLRAKRDWCEFERRSIIAACFRWRAESAAGRLSSSSIDEEVAQYFVRTLDKLHFGLSNILEFEIYTLLALKI